MIRRFFARIHQALAALRDAITGNTPLIAGAALVSVAATGVGVLAVAGLAGATLSRTAADALELSDDVAPLVGLAGLVGGCLLAFAAPELAVLTIAGLGAMLLAWGAVRIAAITGMQAIWIACETRLS